VIANAKVDQKDKVHHGSLQLEVANHIAFTQHGLFNICTKEIATTQSGSISKRYP